MRYYHVLCELLKTHRGSADRIDAAEIGVAHGRTSRILLKTFPTLRLVMVDPWDAARTRRYDETFHSSKPRTKEKLEAAYKITLRRTQRFADRRQILRYTSLEAAKLFEPMSFDMVFLDDDHTYEGVREGLAAWGPKLRPGGIFCGHDYGGPNTGVSEAVTDWAGTTHRLIHLEDGMVWWTRM